MRVLVMGGTEFISLHLLRALQPRGHEVTVFIRDRRGSGLWGGQRPTLKPYVTEDGGHGWAPAAEGR
jgi:nucleoside-diphosphate-sugar epimerase